MSDTTHTRLVHFCTRCGSSFGRVASETIQYGCGECSTYPMRHAVVSWVEQVPDPDPLEALLVGPLEEET